MYRIIILVHMTIIQFCATRLDHTNPGSVCTIKQGQFSCESSFQNHLIFTKTLQVHISRFWILKDQDPSKIFCESKNAKIRIR